MKKMILTVAISCAFGMANAASLTDVDFAQKVERACSDREISQSARDLNTTIQSSAEYVSEHQGKAFVSKHSGGLWFAEAGAYAQSVAVNSNDIHVKAAAMDLSVRLGTEAERVMSDGYDD